ncbi:MAG TPA: FAD-dependent oxidoreductase [Intrasporangium sp.]|nr:FAD-dependent oxidoreductase [Intrasporangium sp.]
MSRTHPATAPAAARVDTADVVVVGARVAGAATATHLARAGHDVVMVDRADFPSDTISTHVIPRSGMVQLGRLGVVSDLVESGAPRLRLVEFTSALGFLSRTIKDRYGVDFVMAPRRYVLDDILQRAALTAGARLRAGVSVDGVLRNAAGRVVGVRGHDGSGPMEVHARHVVGADGLSSRIARSVDAQPTIVRPSSGACQYAYYSGEWEAIEYHLADGVFAGVFPTHRGEACVWAITTESLARRYRRRHHTPDDSLAAVLSDHVPGLATRLAPEDQRSPVRGMLRMPNHFRKPFGPGWSLVGDAGYHRDAITGHGISDALRDAELLAQAVDTTLRCPSLEVPALAAYEFHRDRMSARIFEITVALATFPEQETFVALQRDLAVAIDDLAGELHARPLPRAAGARVGPQTHASLSAPA